MSNWQFLISENVNMKVIDVLVEVPCFKCLFVEPIRESHLHCNPNECEKLTDWLLLQVKNDGKAEETVKFTIVHAHTQG
jgi:hypothetical protein